MARKPDPKSAKTERNLVGPILGVVAGIAIVVAIFLFTDRSAEQSTSPVSDQMAATPQSQPAPPAPEMDLSQVRRIDVAEAKRLLDAGEAITIDVRDVQSYVAGHIPGALQIPLQYVAGEVPWFPKDKTLITYCT